MLLKSDAAKPVGFQTKLSDFGLAKILRENYYIVNRWGQGHLMRTLWPADRPQWSEAGVLTHITYHHCNWRSLDVCGARSSVATTTSPGLRSAS